MTIIAKIPYILLAVNDFSSVLFDVLFSLRKAMMPVCRFVFAPERLIIARNYYKAAVNLHLSHPSGKLLCIRRILRILIRQYKKTNSRLS
jgi:hypothetical protein